MCFWGAPACKEKMDVYETQRCRSFGLLFNENFSGFDHDEYENYLNSCDLYTVDDCTDRRLSYFIKFKNKKVYNIFENIVFMNYSCEFKDRINGLVHSLQYKGEKVVLHLHKSSDTFHIQGKGSIKWFKEKFIIFRKQLHNEINYFLKSQNSYTYNVAKL